MPLKPLSRTDTIYRIEEIPPQVMFEIEDHINRTARRGARVVSMSIGPSRQITILWAMDVPNEDWMALIDAIPQKPPRTAAPLRVGKPGDQIDLTDEAKARMFDRVREILYGKDKP